jgi:hypothetical protein
MPTFRNAAPYSTNLDNAEATPITAVRVLNGAGEDVFPADPALAGAVWLDPFNGSGLNVDGSGSPVTPYIMPQEGQTITIHALALIVQDATVGALTDLGAVPGVSAGLEVKTTLNDNATILGPVKSNGGMLLAGVEPKPYGGEYVWIVKRTLAEPLTLTDQDTLSLEITDDLTGLTSATLYVAVVIG